MRPECATTKPTSGASCASLTGAASGPPQRRWSATSRRSGAGRSTVGRRLKKSAPRAAHHHLRRRKRTERTAASSADLGAARTNSGAAISFQLEGALGRGGDHLVELLLPPLSHDHSRAAGGRFSRSSLAPPFGPAAGGLGRAAGPSGPRGQRLYCRAAGTAGDRALARLRSGTQSGRIYLGLLETSRAAQLLSARLRPTQLSGAPGAVPHASPAPPGARLLATSPTASVAILCKTQ